MITATISSGLDDVKRLWFDHCVVAIELALFADKAEKAKVIHTMLDGAASVAITGYQFCSASGLIAKQSYIAKGSRQDFLDLLLGRISEAGMRELPRYIKRYEQVSDELETQRFRTGLDVARYVIGQEPTMMISLHAASLVQTLYTSTCQVVANAFGGSRLRN